jgi:hypothetical protein
MYHLQGGYFSKRSYDLLKRDIHFKNSIKIKKYGEIAKNTNYQNDNITMDYIKNLLNKYILI